MSVQVSKLKNFLNPKINQDVKIWAAIVSQVDGDNPTIVKLIQDDFDGNISFVRDGIGVYFLNSPISIFYDKKTVINYSLNIPISMFNTQIYWMYGNWWDEKNIYFVTGDAGGKLDSIMGNTYIEIKVYNT